jgi:hypothetical protein
MVSDECGDLDTLADRAFGTDPLAGKPKKRAAVSGGF